MRADDFARFDWFIGMTGAHGAALRRLTPQGARAQVALMLDFACSGRGDVPGPWYGDDAAFVHAFDPIEDGVDGLMVQLRAGHD